MSVAFRFYYFKLSLIPYPIGLSPSLTFSLIGRTTGLRLSERCCAATPSTEKEMLPDADTV